MGLSRFVKQLVLAHKLTFEEGRFEMLGKRGVILPAELLVTLADTLAADQDPDTALETLFRIGRRHGQQAVADRREDGMARREFFQDYVSAANIMGLGRIEITYHSDEPVTATLTDSPLTQHFRASDAFRDREQPVHALFRGMLHGAVEATLDTAVSSEETQCAFLGADHCRFRVAPTDR